MDITEQAMSFADSEEMKKYLMEKKDQGEIALSEEDMLSLVWNSRATLDEKQAFYLFLEKNDIASEMTRRYEKLREYLEEDHASQDYVLVVDDRFFGVYHLYSAAYADFENFRDEVTEDSEILLELYDVRTSTYRGRIRLNQDFEIIGFEFTPELVEAENLWTDSDTDRVIRKYIQFPSPFQAGDLVKEAGIKGVWVCEYTDQPPKSNSLHFWDIAVRASRGTGLNSGEEEKETRMLPLLGLSHAENPSPQEKS